LGVEVEEGTKRVAVPFEFFKGFTFQEAVVGEACGTGKAAHEIQNDPLSIAVSQSLFLPTPLTLRLV
jgi:hypothetical protein